MLHVIPQGIYNHFSKNVCNSIIKYFFPKMKTGTHFFPKIKWKIYGEKNNI